MARLKQLALDGRLLGSGQLDLSGLLDPGAFLNALRQETATALQQPMDKLRLVSTWDAAKLGQAPCTVLLAGIRIAAASFDGKQLSEVASDAAMSTVTTPPHCLPDWRHALG